MNRCTVCHRRIWPWQAATITAIYNRPVKLGRRRFAYRRHRACGGSPIWWP